MAKTALIVKQRREPKFSVRAYNRCQRCGRRKAYIRQFNICRICLRDMSSFGQIPGVTKASW